MRASRVLFSVAVLYSVLPGQTMSTRPVREPALSFVQTAGRVVVRNERIRAELSTTAGLRVHRIEGNGRLKLAIPSDTLRIGGNAFVATKLTVEDRSSYYGRVVVTGTAGSYHVRRIYELTRSSNIYEQLEVTTKTFRFPAQAEWTVGCDSTQRVHAHVSTDDLYVATPVPVLGGLTAEWPGARFRSSARAIQNGWKRSFAVPAMLTGQKLLVNMVLTANAHREDALDFEAYPFHQFHFYARYGLRIDRETAGRFTFLNWNSYKYAMDNMLPISNSGNRQKEDAMIRYGVHLRDRLANIDAGWFRNAAWGDYPHGDRGTPNSRSFPALIFLWAHLTMDRIGDIWIHRASDADVFYHQMQRTFAFMDPHSTSSFSDRRTRTNTPYLAYSFMLNERRGNGPKGVINAHAHALHFADLMLEASQMMRNLPHVLRWRDVVETHHPGSRELFRELYPAVRDGRRYLGLLNYAEGRGLHKTIGYSSITYEGISPGYLHAREFEPEFADIMERCSRRDWDPLDNDVLSIPNTACVAKLWRVFPPSLAFAASVTKPPRRFDSLRDTTHRDKPVIPWARWYTHPKIKVLAGNFDGDANGTTDVMKVDVRTNGGVGSGGLWVGTSNGSRFAGTRWGTWQTHANTFVLAGDFTGDGKDDVMKIDTRADGVASSGGLWVGRSTGSSFATTRWASWYTHPRIKPLVGDFTGDGKDDVMKLDVRTDGGSGAGGLWVGRSTGSSFSTTRWSTWITHARIKPLVGDFNGDGKDDVMKVDVRADGVASRGGLWVGRSTGTSFSTSKWGDWYTHPNIKVFAGDFDGNGKDDVMKIDVHTDGRSGVGGLWVGLSDGFRFSTTKWAEWATHRNIKVFVGDFNGDGKDDIMKFDVRTDGALDTLGVWVGISTGRSFRTARWANWRTSSLMKPLVGDFDGDGTTDIMKFDTFATPGFYGLWVGQSKPMPVLANTATGRSLSVVGLQEALRGADSRSVHDPNTYIVEGGGRQYIRTNTRIDTTWSRGFWEERARHLVPTSKRFTVNAWPGIGGSAGHYAASLRRDGPSRDRIDLMTDFDANYVAVNFELGKGAAYTVHVRDYDAGRWLPERRIAGARLPQGRGSIELGRVARKALVTIRMDAR